METNWNRGSFRPGGGDYGLLDEMLAQEQEGAAEKEKGETERGDGRGDAIFDGAPKPQPGDELHATLYQARAEATGRTTVQHEAPAVSNDSALAFAALIAASPQQDVQPQEAPVYRAAAQETAQPDAERPQPATFHALRAEQSAAMLPQGVQSRQPEQEAAPAEEAPARPGDRQGQNGLMSDFVTGETQQTVEAERAQQQRSRVMGLSL